MKKLTTFAIIILLSISAALAQVFKPDILGGKFEAATIVMPKDYEGDVVCTLVRLLADTPTNKAALYIHGLNDYFFQTEMAEQFVAHGYNFYALDLRKYGRSLLPNQRRYNARKIKEYYADIDTAIAIIQHENNNFIVLCGHSTGGLTAALYAEDGAKRQAINAIWLNSPFFDMNLGFALKRLGVPLVSNIGRLSPNISIPIGSSSFYGESLHKKYRGEWDYNLDWKLLNSPKMKSGWIRAIHRAQKRIHKGLNIQCPTLVMHSDKTLGGTKWDDSFHRADIVLNVEDIDKYARKLGKNVTVEEIEGGKHDLVLSLKDVRAKVYRDLFQWLKNIN
jgi:alpha-beta hydrolase superfamily lysophospholipase